MVEDSTSPFNVVAEPMPTAQDCRWRHNTYGLIVSHRRRECKWTAGLLVFCHSSLISCCVLSREEERNPIFYHKHILVLESITSVWKAPAFELLIARRRGRRQILLTRCANAPTCSFSTSKSLPTPIKVRN